jgi:hypothetical protein
VRSSGPREYRAMRMKRILKTRARLSPGSKLKRLTPKALRPRSGRHALAVLSRAGSWWR